MTDEVDDLQAQWRRSRPDLDVEPAGVFVRLLRISRLVDARTDAALATFGIDRAGFEVLSLLLRADRPAPPAQIAAELHITRAGVTKRLRPLETAALIERRSHGHDGRSVLISITAQGRAAVLPAVEAVQQLEASWLAALPRADRATLEPALRQLLAILTAEPAQAG